MSYNFEVELILDAQTKVNEIEAITDSGALLNYMEQSAERVNDVSKKSKQQMVHDYFVFGKCANRLLFLSKSDPEKYGTEEENLKKMREKTGKTNAQLNSIMHFVTYTDILKYDKLGPTNLISVARTLDQFIELETTLNPDQELPEKNVADIIKYALTNTNNTDNIEHQEGGENESQDNVDINNNNSTTDKIYTILKSIAHKPSYLFGVTIKKAVENESEKYNKIFENDKLNISYRTAQNLVRIFGAKKVNYKAADTIIDELSPNETQGKVKISERDRSAVREILNEERDKIKDLLNEKGIGQDDIQSVLNSFETSLWAIGNFYSNATGVKKLTLTSPAS